MKLGGLGVQCYGVAAGAEADYLEAVSVGAHDVEGLTADAAGRAQDGEAALQEKVLGTEKIIRTGVCSIPPGR